MNLSQEQLKEIQKYAMLQFTAKEIAILLELDQKELVETIKDETSEPFKYFQKGRLSVEAHIRKAMYDLALSGDLKAQKEISALIEYGKLEDEQ